MKRPSTVSAVFAVTAMAAAAISTPLKAQNYPWCAHIDTGYDDALNCGFVSFAQCMQTVRGMGGFCQSNNTYRPPLSAPDAARRLPPRARY